MTFRETWQTMNCYFKRPLFRFPLGDDGIFISPFSWLVGLDANITNEDSFRWQVIVAASATAAAAMKNHTGLLCPYCIVAMLTDNKKSSSAQQWPYQHLPLAVANQVTLGKSFLLFTQLVEIQSNSHRQIIYDCRLWNLGQVTSKF